MAVSLRAYAAHRKSLGLPGASLQAVQRAIDRQRLYESVVRVHGSRKILDVDVADREWAANTDLSKAPSYVVDRTARGEGRMERRRLAQALNDPGDGPMDPARISITIVDNGLLFVVHDDDASDDGGFTLDRAGALALAERLIETANHPVMSLPVPP
jgi:hypothetical protein